MKLKGGFSFKIGDISLCLNDSGRKRKMMIREKG